MITNVAAAGCLAVCNAIAPEQEFDLFGHEVSRQNPIDVCASNPILKEVLEAIDTVSTTSKCYVYVTFSINADK